MMISVNHVSLFSGVMILEQCHLLAFFVVVIIFQSDTLHFEL